jgi:type VI secretion system protein ImpH
MAGSGGKSGTDLIRLLQDNPQEFEFFQAVRLLEMRAMSAPGSRRIPVGSDGPVSDECIRFRALVSLCFPAGQISSVKPRNVAERQTGYNQSTPETDQNPPQYEMTVPFMGLAGPGGALPQHYTSLIIERSHSRNRDYALQEFFDLFNHRMISLFCRAWEKYRFPIAYERSLRDSMRQDDLFTQCLCSIIGTGISPLRERFSFDDQHILAYGGLFAQTTRSAVGLEQILSDCFRLPATIQQFIGHWLQLAREEQSCLPSKTNRFGQNLVLGDDAVAGTRVWDVQCRFRVVFGPLTWSVFRTLLPGSRKLQEITEVIRFYAGINRDFDIQFVLKPDEIVPCRLGSTDTYEPRLGWTTWMDASTPRDQDVRDVVLRF